MREREGERTQRAQILMQSQCVWNLNISNEEQIIECDYREWRMDLPNDLSEYDGRMERALNFNRSSSEKQAKLMIGGVWGSSAPSSSHTLSVQLSWQRMKSQFKQSASPEVTFSQSLVSRPTPPEPTLPPPLMRERERERGCVEAEGGRKGNKP